MSCHATMTCPRPPMNGLAVAGFVCSLAGFFTGGVLSPVGLILSLFALGAHPRGLAIAGVILGLLGSGCITAIVGAGLITAIIAALGAATVAGVVMFEPRADADRDLTDLRGAVTAYYTDHRVLPEHLGTLVPEYYTPRDGHEALIDPWKKPYRYEASLDGGVFSITSDGPDGRPGTRDDRTLTSRVDQPTPAAAPTPAVERPRRRTF